MHKRRRSFESLRAGRRAEVNFASNSITLSRSSLSYREYQLRDVDSSDHLFSQNQPQGLRDAIVLANLLATRVDFSSYLCKLLKINVR